jgi:hypothetical protein
MRPILQSFLLATATSLLTACGGGSSADPMIDTAAQPPADRITSQPIRVVATPNPNVFPLLLAMARQPTMPAVLVPIADGAQIDSTFAAGQGDALLAMTYTMAKKVTTGKVADLQLLRVNLWRGFSELTLSSASITNFSQLLGKGLLVSGPTSGGKGGGPDLIFQAALRRAGYSVADFKVCYLPVMQAAPMIAEQQKMNTNQACDPSFDFAPAAISLVEPAATGLVMQTLMPTSANAVPLARSIDFQALFTGYGAWPASQLPHGGLAALGTVLADATRQATMRSVLSAYDAAVAEIAAATPAQRIQIAQIVSAGITKYYGNLGLDLPAPVIAAALASGELVIRSDLTLTTIQADLDRFLTEVVGSSPPAKFYRAQGF